MNGITRHAVYHHHASACTIRGTLRGCAEQQRRRSGQAWICAWDGQAAGVLSHIGVGQRLGRQATARRG